MRDLRVTVPGWIFCIVFACGLLSAPDILDGFLRSAQQHYTFLAADEGGNRTFGLIAFLTGGLFTIFGAAPVGYLISATVFFLFNLKGGYHEVWKRHFPEQMREAYEQELAALWGKDRLPFLRGSKTKLLDVPFSVDWQDSNNALLVEWVSRRFTTYFLNWSIIFAMFFGYLGSWLFLLFICRAYSLSSPVQMNLVLLMVIFVLSLILWTNGHQTASDAADAVVLWKARRTSQSSS